MATDAELGLRDRLAKLSGVKLLRGTKLSVELERLQRQLERLKEDTSDEEIWKRVELARHQERPYTLDYVERILEDFFELRGDRAPHGRSRHRGGARAARRARPWLWSATRKAAISRSARTATSAWPTLRATARQCG